MGYRVISVGYCAVLQIGKSMVRIPIDAHHAPSVAGRLKGARVEIKLCMLNTPYLSMVLVPGSRSKIYVPSLYSLNTAEHDVEQQ